MEKRVYMCPLCLGRDLVLRHEASYVYSYVVDSDIPGLQNSEEFLSYLYDKREQTASRNYIECKTCGTQYPLHLLNEALLQGEGEDEHGIRQRKDDTIVR